MSFPMLLVSNLGPALAAVFARGGGVTDPSEYITPSVRRDMSRKIDLTLEQDCFAEHTDGASFDQPGS